MRSWVGLGLGEAGDVAGTAHFEALGDPRPRHRGFLPQQQGQLRLLYVAFGAGGQFGFGPAGVFHPLVDQPLGAVFVGFVAFTGLLVFLAGTAEAFGEVLGEVRRAQPPATAEGVPLAGGFAFAPALFQAFLKMDAVPGGVALDAVAAQEPIHAEPGRALGGPEVEVSIAEPAAPHEPPPASWIPKVRILGRRVRGHRALSAAVGEPDR